MEIRTQAASRTVPSDADEDAETRVSDATLLAGCRTGDARSWDLLVRRYERLVYSVALRTGLSSADAADITQNTFVALLEACGRLRDDERLAAWLVTVTRRKAWRMIRRASHELPRSEIPHDDGADALPWEDITALHEALLQLSSPCRELLIALYFDPDQPSYAEIASRFDRSVGGIGPLRGRCLERMRGLLSDVPE